MLAIEEVLRELGGEDVNEQGLPPGFRFHPTDEELITFYLASKVFNGSFCGVQIAEVDLNRCEPWELPDVAKMGEREWYFFSLRDRKYPTGLRTNRATGSGYWKATGKDREVHSASSGGLLGMKKTLVFYMGRAPRGQKTKWVMHEYRLDGHFSYRHACKEEWVICRIFHKTIDKKNQILQDEGYFQGGLSSPTGTGGSWLPPLLEAPSNTLPECQSQRAFGVDPQDELKAEMNAFMSESQLFAMAGLRFQASSSSKDSPDLLASGAGAGSMLIKSLLSHQDWTTEEDRSTISKHCKAESNNFHLQMLNASFKWGWGDNPHCFPPDHPEPLEIDGNSGNGSSLMGSSASASATDNRMSASTSIVLNRMKTMMMPPSDYASRGLLSGDDSCWH